MAAADTVREQRAAIAVDGRLIALLLVGAMTIMAGATISPSLPAIEREVASGDNAALLTRLVLTVPALFTALTALVAGAALDRFGRRRILLAAIVLYALAGPAGGLMSNVWALLATRALLGVAVGIVMTASVTLVTDYYAGPQRGEVMGRQAAFAGIGGIVFLVGGGLLADLSWRAPFAIYLLALPVLVMAWRFLPEPSRAAAADHDDGGIMRRGPVALLAMLAFTSMVVFYLTPVQIPFHLEALGAPSGTLAGIAVASTTLTGAVASALYGRVRARLARSLVFAVLFAPMAAGYAIVALAAGPALVIAGLAIFGMGFGLLIPNLNTLAGDLATDATRGTVIGTLTTSLFLGQFASPLVAQPVIERFGSAGAYWAGASMLALLAVGFAVANRPGGARSGTGPASASASVK